MNRNKKKTCLLVLNGEYAIITFNSSSEERKLNVGKTRKTEQRAKRKQKYIFEYERIS